MGATMGKNGGTILDSLPSTQVSELISNVVAVVLFTSECGGFFFPLLVCKEVMNNQKWG